MIATCTIRSRAIPENSVSLSSNRSTMLATLQAIYAGSETPGDGRCRKRSARQRLDEVP
jgi:hypothetical protein